ncbi:MAG: transcriptional regulator [Polyangiaceae bacterium]|nr:transcriptional regulator [Polyangiaceae bacterium]
MGRRPLCVCELENELDLSQPTVSHHLRTPAARTSGEPDAARNVGVLRADRKAAADAPQAPIAFAR